MKHSDLPTETLAHSHRTYDYATWHVPTYLIWLKRHIRWKHPDMQN